MGQSLEEIKRMLSEMGAELVEHFSIIHPEINVQKIHDLIEDISSDIYTVVVLGEFSRGKSTFINALIGEDLLPVDVTPTTAAIHALMYGEQEKITIHFLDGKIKEKELSKEALKEFVAEELEEISTIKYIAVTMPNDSLKGRLAIVDTPGVDDINKLRAEVTYQFIPRADTVFFLLDATSPLRRTELEFITDTLLNEGKERIVFLANYMDQLEEEEAEDAVEMIGRRLAIALGKQGNEVLPLSAKKAMIGKLEADAGLIEQSGITDIEKKMREMITHGSSAEEKILQFERRFHLVTNELKRQLSSKKQLESLTADELKKQLELIRKTTDKLAEIESDIKEYVIERKEEMKIIIQKSVKHFLDDLQEDVMMMIDDYEGLNFKNVLEKQVPLMVKKRMKQWIEQYIQSIHKLFEMLEKEIAIGLATEFNTSITVLRGKRHGMEKQENGLIELSSDDISNTPVMAGVLAGGAGALAMILGGPLLLPIVGMAGFPFIMKKLVEHKLGRAKEAVRPIVEERLQETFAHFYIEIETYVQQNTDAIYYAAVERFEELSFNLKRQVEKQIKEKEQSNNQSLDKVSKIEQSEKFIENLQQSMVEGANDAIYQK